MKYLCIAAVCAVLTACGGSGDSDSTKRTDSAALLKLIEQQQVVWSNFNIQSYTFSYYRPPTDCPMADPLPTAEITVIDGQVSQVYYVMGEQMEYEGSDLSGFPTLDNLFEQMKEDLDYIQGTPEFDETYGFPLSFAVDLSSKECDGYRVSVFEFF